MGRAEGPTAKAIWGWILLVLSLWGVLQVGAALVLKGSRERGEVFAFDALCCDRSHALGRHSGRRVCGEGRIRADNGMTIKVPAGEPRHTAAGTGNHLPSDSMQEEAVDNEGGMRVILAQ